jgi:hypothetical protein
MTDQPASLAAALALLQTQLPPIAKTSKAQYGNYADLADVSKDLLPVMGNLGLSFSARPTWVQRDDGSREFVLAYKLRHVSGESDEGEYPLVAADKQVNHQQLGGAITYGRRYALCAITGAVADDDDDGQQAAAAGPVGQKRAARQPRETPPIRPLDELPRNQDGTISRSRVTNEELAHYGLMTDAEQRAHNKLERDVKGTDSKGKSPGSTERLGGTPPDDPWLNAEPVPLRTPHAAQPVAGVIHAYFKRLGPYTDEQRYGAMTTITGRRITSTNDLTAAEAIEVKRFLAECRDGDVLIERLAAKAGENSA